MPVKKATEYLLRLPRRVYLTGANHGWREVFVRALTFPLRPTSLGRRLGYGTDFGPQRARLRVEHLRARKWFRKNARPVTVVIPTYGDPDLALKAARSIKRTTRRYKGIRVVLVDDGSAPERQGKLRNARGVEAVLGERTLGFAGNVNRGLAATKNEDVVVLNSDIIAHAGWLERLQYAAYRHEKNGIIGPKLLYPDGRIQSAGSHRNLDAPEWFDHRYRFKPANYGPANISAQTVAVTGACMYLKRALIDAVGHFDEEYEMGFEDVDYCLRAWEAGFYVLYYPCASLTHLESVTRGREVGEREQRSQARFWQRWQSWFDDRSVTTADGKLRVIYVTEETGVGGGHRDIFEHLNRLAERGHEVELYSLGGQPDWFPLKAKVRTFSSYRELAEELAEQDAIKIATWWNTAAWVWLASVRKGMPVYFVQDIETSYYPEDQWTQYRVLASYRQEFNYMTISGCNSDKLTELGLTATLVPPGLDLENFHPLESISPQDGVLLAIGRTNPLKNFDLTVAAWRALEQKQPQLVMFGIEPQVGDGLGAQRIGATGDLLPELNSALQTNQAVYIEQPSDKQVNELFNLAQVFVQTSRHEGFCLPIIEAMAAGTPVVCTDAHGNRDFCLDGKNCLMVEDNPAAVAKAIERLLSDEDLRQRLIAGGITKASEYAWERRIDELELFFNGVAEAKRPALQRG